MEEQRPSSAEGGYGGGDGVVDLAVLDDAEAALQHFKRDVWEQSAAAARREDVKRQLHESFTAAKEIGELVAYKRRCVGDLRARLAETAGGGGGGGAEGEGEEEEASLRLRLQLDTAAYKDAVAQLRELKPHIGQLQEQLQRSQKALEAEFGKWHAAALAKARGAAAAPATTKGARGGARRPPSAHASPPCRDSTNLSSEQQARGGVQRSPRYVGIY